MLAESDFQFCVTFFSGLTTFMYSKILGQVNSLSVNMIWHSKFTIPKQTENHLKPHWWRIVSIIQIIFHILHTLFNCLKDLWFLRYVYCWHKACWKNKINHLDCESLKANGLNIIYIYMANFSQLSSIFFLLGSSWPWIWWRSTITHTKTHDLPHFWHVFIA